MNGGSNPTQGICLYGTVAVINNNSLQRTRYILLKKYGIDRSESEMTCCYSNSRTPGDLISCLQYNVLISAFKEFSFCLISFEGVFFLCFKSFFLLFIFCFISFGILCFILPLLKAVSGTILSTTLTSLLSNLSQRFWTLFTFVLYSKSCVQYANMIN